jgi:hypothetical protein
MPWLNQRRRQFSGMHTPSLAVQATSRDRHRATGGSMRARDAGVCERETGAGGSMCATGQHRRLSASERLAQVAVSERETGGCSSMLCQCGAVNCERLAAAAESDRRRRQHACDKPVPAAAVCERRRDRRQRPSGTPATGQSILPVTYNFLGNERLGMFMSATRRRGAVASRGRPRFVRE